MPRFQLQPRPAGAVKIIALSSSMLRPFLASTLRDGGECAAADNDQRRATVCCCHDDERSHWLSFQLMHAIMQSALDHGLAISLSRDPLSPHCPFPVPRPPPTAHCPPCCCT